jgi:hypothetical protein
LEIKFIYYSYRNKDEYPVYVRFSNEMLEQKLQSTLTQIGFQKAVTQDFKEQEQPPHWVVLDLDWASARAAKRMMSSEIKEQTFGVENISQNQGYYNYNYRGFFSMVYGANTHLWQGRFLANQFEQNLELKLRIVLFRFLSFALMPLKVVGLWGVPVDNGVVVTSQSKAEAEALFVDLNTQKLLTIEGEKPINGYLEIIRLDATLSNTSRNMSSEELISFLLTHTTALGPLGVPSQTRQAILSMEQFCNGIVYPEMKFQPRASLSYEG